MALPERQRLIRAIPLAAALAALPIGVHAQAGKAAGANAPVHFDVASVRVNRDLLGPRFIRRLPGGRFTATNVPVRDLIEFAYSVSARTLIGGPGWIDAARFDVIARLDGDPPIVTVSATDPDSFQRALRTLLAERFRLTLHRETRQADAYALAMVKPGVPGPRLKRSTQDCSPRAAREAIARGAPPPRQSGGPLPCGDMYSPTTIRFGGMPLTNLLEPLARMTGRPVIDRTGLSGTWDFDLDFAPVADSAAADAPADPSLPSLYTAFREQLGIKFESTRTAIDVLVIDRIQEPLPD